MTYLRVSATVVQTCTIAPVWPADWRPYAPPCVPPAVVPAAPPPEPLVSYAKDPGTGAMTETVEF